MYIFDLLTCRLRSVDKVMQDIGISVLKSPEFKQVFGKMRKL